MSSAPQPFRRAGRVDFSAHVDLQSGAGSYRGTAKNIGTGGIFVATPVVLGVGESLVLNFSLPGLTDPVWVAAVVRWVRGGDESARTESPGMGLAFVSLAFEARAAVQSYLRAHDVPHDAET